MLYTVMRSITKIIQYIHKYKTQADSVVSYTNAFINFWLSVHGNTRRETHFLKSLFYPYHADHPPCGDVKISDDRDPKNPTTRPTVENSTLCLHGPISTDSFSKSSNSQDHLFRAWGHPHSSPISCLRVYYDNGDCHILCACALKLHPMTLHLNSWSE